MKYLVIALLLFSAHLTLAASPVATCPGTILELKNESAQVTYDKAASTFSVKWVNAKKKTAVLDTVKKFNDEPFELQCMTGKEVLDTKKSLADSEGIHDFLKVPKGQGAFCYFTDETTTTCWTYDKKKKAFVNAGGWQT
jgi:hypothetical protein